MSRRMPVAVVLAISCLSVVFARAVVSCYFILRDLGGRRLYQREFTRAQIMTAIILVVFLGLQVAGGAALRRAVRTRSRQEALDLAPMEGDTPMLSYVVAFSAFSLLMSTISL